MAFGGVLLLNLLLMIVFGMAAVGIVCLLLSAIFFIVYIVKKRRGAVQGKGKRIAAIVLLIVGLCSMIIPVGLCLIFYPNDKKVVETPEGETTVREMQVKSFELAIGSDDAEEVEKLLKKNPALLYYTWDNVLPLGRAISTESVNVVTFLLEYGVDVDQADNLDFDTSMTYATRNLQKMTEEESFEILNLLIDYGADMNETLSGISPVQYLIRYIVEDSSVSTEELKMLEQFILAGASLTQEDLGGKNAIDLFEREAGHLELDEEQQAEFEAMRELLMKHYNDSE